MESFPVRLIARNLVQQQTLQEENKEIKGKTAQVRCTFSLPTVYHVFGKYLPTAYAYSLK